MQYVLLAGRILFSSIFILASFGHFSPSSIEMAGEQGMPIPYLLIPLFGLIILAGGLSILLGFRARWGAWLLAFYLVISTFLMHPFWQEQDAMMASIDQIMFFKNVSMLGAALMVAYFGSGPLSLDHIWRKK